MFYIYIDYYLLFSLNYDWLLLFTLAGYHWLLNVPSPSFQIALLITSVYLRLLHVLYIVFKMYLQIT